MPGRSPRSAFPGAVASFAVGKPRRCRRVFVSAGALFAGWYVFDPARRRPLADPRIRQRYDVPQCGRSNRICRMKLEASRTWEESASRSPNPVPRPTAPHRMCPPTGRKSASKQFSVVRYCPAPAGEMVVLRQEGARVTPAISSRTRGTSRLLRTLVWLGVVSPRRDGGRPQFRLRADRGRGRVPHPRPSRL
jgi:hypothetical protein